MIYVRYYINFEFMLVYFTDKNANSHIIVKRTFLHIYLELLDKNINYSQMSVVFIVKSILNMIPNVISIVNKIMFSYPV